MITISSYTKVNPELDYFEYLVSFVVEGLPIVYYPIEGSEVETNGQWDGQKALDYLNARHDKLLVLARERNVQVIDKKLEVTKEVEASDFIVASPEIPKDPEEAREKIKEEKNKTEKSIATIDLCLAEVVEDLVKRVKELEKKP